MLNLFQHLLAKHFPCTTRDPEINSGWRRIFMLLPQRGSLFVENVYINFGSLPQRGNLSR